MSTGRARLSELQVAAMLLTRLPAGAISGDVPGLRDARWAFPLVGVMVGILTWFVHAAFLAIGASDAMAAVLAVAAMALVTGALHFDGLADFADGIGGGRDRAHCLEIMRDSRIGSYGVLALGLAAGTLAASLAALGDDASLPAFLAIAALSRAAMVAALEMLPSARPDGLGADASGSSLAARMAAVVTILLSIVLLGWPGVVVVLGVAAASIVMGWLAYRRIGGQTGDVLGAIQLLSETAGWVCLAILAS